MPAYEWWRELLEESRRHRLAVERITGALEGTGPGPRVFPESEIYYITRGMTGPVVDGPYGGDRVAAMARGSLRRTWGMWWRREHYYLMPKICLSAEQRAGRGIPPDPPREEHSPPEQL